MIRRYRINIHGDVMRMDESQDGDWVKWGQVRNILERIKELYEMVEENLQKEVGVSVVEGKDG